MVRSEKHAVGAIRPVCQAPCACKRVGRNGQSLAVVAAPLVLPSNLAPFTGVRSGEENHLRVEIRYHPATTMAFPAGQIQLDPQLCIDLAPELAQEESDDDLVFVDISAAVTAVLSRTEPARLLEVDGAIGTLDEWAMVPRLVGEKIWAEAKNVVDRQLEDVAIDVADAEVDGCRDAWSELLEAGRSNRIVSLPLDRERREREFEILVSDPDFFRKGREMVRWVFGPPDEPPPKW